MALTLKVSGQNDKIMKKIEKMEKFISSVAPKLQCMEDQIHDLQDENESLKAVNKDRWQSVKAIEVHQDEKEQRQLRKSVVMDIAPSCILDGINPVQTAVATLRNELGIPENILRDTFIRRLGKNTKFLVETPCNLARNMINAERTVRSNKVYINEFLTKSRSKLYYDLRNLQKLNEEIIAAVYVNDGKIYVRRVDEQRWTQITRLVDVTDWEDVTTTRAVPRSLNSNELSGNSLIWVVVKCYHLYLTLFCMGVGVRSPPL